MSERIPSDVFLVAPSFQSLCKKSIQAHLRDHLDDLWPSKAQDFHQFVCIFCSIVCKCSCVRKKNKADTSWS